MKWFAIIAFSLLAFPAAAAPKVCAFLGDSVTLGVRVKQNVTERQRFSYLVSKRLRCKEINAGVGGDTTTGMLERFDRDFAAHKPSRLYVMTENDYWPGDLVPFDKSEANLREIVAKGKALGATVTIITPPPVGRFECGPPVPRDSCRKIASQQYLEASYVEMQRRVARDTGVKLIDVHKLRWTGRHYVDPWNPSAAGQKLIADQIR